jgi:hypothetical protein
VRRVLIFIALVVVAILLARRGPEDAVETVQASVKNPDKRFDRLRSADATAGSAIYGDLALARARSGGSATDLFAPRSWGQPPEPRPLQPTGATRVRHRDQSAVAATASELGVRTALSVPPLPFTYVGKLKHGDDPTVVYLANGALYHQANVGDTVERDYRIAKIDDDAIEFLYLPANQIQRLLIRAE